MSPNLTRLTVKFTRVNLFPSRDQFAMDPSPNWRLKIEKKELKNYSSGNGAMFHTELQSMLRFPWKRFKNLKCDGRFTLVNKTNVGLSFCVFLFTLWSKSVNETLFLVRHGLEKFLKIGRNIYGAVFPQISENSGLTIGITAKTAMACHWTGNRKVARVTRTLNF